MGRAVPGERPCYFEAAAEIANRGFDAVVFGHTHRPGETDLGDGRRYFNTGAWLNDPHYLQIDAGVMSLRPVFGSYDAAIPGTWARSRGVAFATSGRAVRADSAACATLACLYSSMAK